MTRGQDYKTRCVFACSPTALVIYLYRDHERTRMKIKVVVDLLTESVRG